MRVLIPAALVCSLSSAMAQTDGAAFYESSVKPILRANCLGCHSDRKLTSGLSLETRDSIKKGGNRGADLQVIIAAVKQTGDLKMPPGKKLTDEQVATLAKWIDMGVPVPADLVKSRRPGANHWAFQPIRRQEPPAVKQSAWIRNSIDRFILSKLEAANLTPSPEADKATLLRRVHLDLTGIPPTPKELSDFVADTTPEAYSKVVERLLSSPHYGERWGRHWLDLARYADSDGYTIDAPRDIWKYRDWVIDAVNRDMPFTQFVIEQIAGDLLPNPTTNQLIATGFHRNTTSNYEGGIDFEQYRVEAVADRVATTGAVFLGLTLGCARCHDHKYDPVTQKEFYQIFSFYNNTDEIDKEDDRKYFNRPFLELPTKEEGARRDAYYAQLSALENESEAYKKKLGEQAAKTDPGVMERDKNIRNLKSREPKVTSTLIMHELATPRQAYIHLGGEFTRHGANVGPGVPASIQPALDVKGRAPNRVDLAKWLVDERNPLTPRVTVNRVWQKYFGKGFVDTENDLGTVGDKPTHPELLDWLASEFMARGWSQKELHRLIVHSATYRQASKGRADATAADPDNRLLARQNRLRLEAEIVRDASLQVSGLFAPAVGGPSVYPPQPPGVYQVTQVRREWKTSEGPDRYRRGMYTFFQRSAPHPSLVVFDAPDSTATCTRRNRSNTPLQALTQLNDEGSVEWANALAKRVESESQDDNQRLRSAYLYALSREPQAAEQDRLLRFLKAQRDSKSQNAWGAVARVILNLDEFLTRP
ncbi:MAG: PSD1 and planctomycete cytochrome C domain-containing protein [Bryobacteraceae bacterium]